MARIKLLWGITGSVAASIIHKVIPYEKEYDIRYIITDRARYFINSSRLYATESRPIYSDYNEWNEDRPVKKYIKDEPVLHVDLAKWCDFMVIAPITMNTIAKLATGICDNLLTSAYFALPALKPVFVAPAMNTNMWQHPINMENLQRMLDMKPIGITFPITKRLACGDEGEGAMAHIDEIFGDIKRWIDSDDKEVLLSRYKKQQIHNEE